MGVDYYDAKTRKRMNGRKEPREEPKVSRNDEMMGAYDAKAPENEPKLMEPSLKHRVRIAHYHRKVVMIHNHVRY